MHTRRLLVPLLTAALLGGGAGLQAQAHPPVGVGAHALDARSVSLLRDLGVRHVRTTLYWNHWESERGYARRVGAELHRAADAGLDVLVVVHGQPGRYKYANRAEAYRAYAAFVGSLARQFPEVRAWQLWNEMDGGTFTDLFGGRGRASPRERGRMYGEMLRLAYPAIKRASPRAVVVTGGIAGGVREGFIDGIHDARGPFDALAIHSYGFPVRGSFVDRGREARALLRKHGSRAALWNTEFGMEAAVVPPDWERGRRAVDRYHLESWRDPILANQEERIYDRAYGHVLKQGGDQSYDLVRRDGSLRPAARWLRDYLR